MPRDGRASVLIADGEAPTRVGLRLALEAGGFEVCSEVETAHEAVSTALREHPDICVLDVSIPGNGIDAARAIAEKLPETAVVMLTSSPEDDDHLFASLRAGACGYLSKELDPQRLIRALHGVLAGEAALPRRLMTRVVDEFREGNTRRHSVSLTGDRTARLTDREWDTLRLLRDGLSTAEVAERMFVAPVTVRTHVAAVVRKLGVQDRAAAVRLLRR